MKAEIDQLREQMSVMEDLKANIQTVFFRIDVLAKVRKNFIARDD
jgi:hypothetical protein